MILTLTSLARGLTVINENFSLKLKTLFPNSSYRGNCAPFLKKFGSKAANLRSLLFNRHYYRLIKVAEVLAEKIDSAAMHGGFLYAEFEAHGFAAGYAERIEIVAVVDEHAVEERAGRGYLDLFQHTARRRDRTRRKHTYRHFRHALARESGNVGACFLR